MITRFAHQVAAKSSFPHASSGNPGYGLFLLLLFFCFTAGIAWSQTKAVAIVGGTLIDGTGRAPLEDSAVVILNGRIQAVGKRGELAIPQDAEVIDAKGKSILPGLIDGHCHYRDWMGEVYLAYGVVTCPNISNNPVEWIVAQREGREKRQCPWSARVGIRQHHRRAAARGHRHA